MDPQNVYSIMTKDFNTFIKKKYVLVTSILLPLALSIGLPGVLFIAKSRGNQTQLPLIFKTLIPSFSFFFVILSAIAPVYIAGYSLVGEKLEKSLEPLLATPLTDGEILLGKSLVAVIPALISIYISSAIFSVAVNYVTDNIYPPLPNTIFEYILIFVIPLVILFSVEIMIIISSRVNDVRTSTQVGMFMMVPFVGIYLLSEAKYITLDPNMMLEIAGILAVIDFLLFFFAKITFKREEILTKWK